MRLTRSFRYNETNLQLPIIPSYRIPKQTELNFIASVSVMRKIFLSCVTRKALFYELQIEVQISDFEVWLSIKSIYRMYCRLFQKKTPFGLRDFAAWFFVFISAIHHKKLPFFVLGKMPEREEPYQFPGDSLDQFADLLWQLCIEERNDQNKGIFQCNSTNAQKKMCKGNITPCYIWFKENYKQTVLL